MAVPTFELQSKFAKWFNDFKQQYLNRYTVKYIFVCIYMYTHIYI